MTDGPQDPRRRRRSGALPDAVLDPQGERLRGAHRARRRAPLRASDGGAVRSAAARHHDAQGGRASAAAEGEGRPALQGPAGPHDLLHAARGGHGPVARSRRHRLHPQAVPGARAAGAGEGASAGGTRAQPGEGGGALPLRDDGHPAGGDRLAQAGRDLPDPGAAGGAGPQHLALLDHHRGARRRSGHRRGGVREPDAAQPRRGPAPLSRDPARARDRRGRARAGTCTPTRSIRWSAPAGSRKGSEVPTRCGDRDPLLAAAAARRSLLPPHHDGRRARSTSRTCSSRSR